MEEDQLKKIKNHSKRSKKVGRMEEAVVVKEKRFQARFFFFIFNKILEEWKKRNKYFLSFSTKY